MAPHGSTRTCTQDLMYYDSVCLPLNKRWALRGEILCFVSHCVSSPQNVVCSALTPNPGHLLTPATASFPRAQIPLALSSYYRSGLQMPPTEMWTFRTQSCKAISANKYL